MPNSFLTSEGSVPDLRKYQSTDEKIEVLQNYLYQLLEELRYTLHNISADDIDTESWNKRLEEATESSKKISLISQTIDEIRMTISQTTDTIEGITSRYADLKLTVDGLIVAVEDGVEFDGSAFVQRSEFEVTASQVSSLVTQVSTNTNSISSLSSRITQTAEAIRTEVSSNYVSNTDMEDIESNWSSSLTQTANSISTSVAETYQTKSDAASVKSELQSAITQSASNITATVASTYETKTDAAGKLETAKSYALSQIGISEGNIRTYVGQTYQTLDSAATMQSSINQNADSITLTAQRISNLKIGSANLLRGSDKFELAESITSVETYNKGRWFLGSSGGSSGYTIHFEINDPPTSGVTNGVSVVNDVGQASLTQQITPASKIICDERTYTYSGYRRVNPDSTKDTVKSTVYISGRKTQGASASVLYNFNEVIEKSDGWQKFRYSFVPDFYTGSGIIFYCGVSGEGTIDYCGLKLEEGDVDTSWEKNEYDIRAAAAAEFKVTTDAITGTVSTLSGRVTEVEQTADRITSTVSSMSVGNRNYILNTEYFTDWVTANSAFNSWFEFDTTNGILTYKKYNSTETSTSMIRVDYRKNHVRWALLRNKTIVFSAEVKGEAGKVGYVGLCPYLTTSATGSRVRYRYIRMNQEGKSANTTFTGDWQKVYYKVKLTDEWFTSGTGAIDFDNCYFGCELTCNSPQSLATESVYPYQLRRPMAAASDVNSDWQPAPEDFTSQIQQTAYAITQKVSAGDVVSVINQSADKIQISAIDIDLSGMVTFTDLTNTSKTIINGGVIQTGTILTGAIHSSAITTDKLNANSVTAGKIAASAITTDKLAANAVTTDKLAANCVTANQIAANSINTGHLQAKAITTDKINTKAITSELINTKAIKAEHIASNTITAEQIAANTITASQIAAGTITATQIKSGTITSNQIAAGTITASNIAAGTITATQIAANTITGAKIAAGTITSTQISSNYVYAGAIKATQISAGTLASNVIYSGAIAASQITSGTISASRIGSETITSGKLRINGTIKFYEDSSATTAYGTIGYATGNDGDSSTDGIRMHVDGTHRLFISNAGAILEGGSRITLKSNLTKCTGNVTCKELTTSGDTYISGGLETVGSVIHLGGSSTTHVYAYSSGELKGQGTVTRNGSGYLSVTGSNRYKKNLERSLTSDDVEPWYDLPIYHGSYKEEYCHEGDTYYGEHLPMFTVEDIEEICPEANFHSSDGSLTDSSWDYFVIIPIMMKMIQDQKKRIDELEGKVS